MYIKEYVKKQLKLPPFKIETYMKIAFNLHGLQSPLLQLSHIRFETHLANQVCVRFVIIRLSPINLPIPYLYILRPNHNKEKPMHTRS